MEFWIWCGIIFCISQSAMFSGLNLAFFSVSKLRLEVERRKGNKSAAKVLALRNDSNFLLTTILWGNVGINVLLTLLSNQVLLGIAAFIFSTVFITLCGEIAPQAYFSRNALRLAGLLSPVLKMYQFLLYPVAKPSAKLLDLWLGSEGVPFYRERDLREVIRLHMSDDTTDISRVEAIGAMNFFKLDDIAASEEGEVLDPESVVDLPGHENGLLFPNFTCQADDPFLKRIEESGKKWIVLTNESGHPYFVLDADNFLRKVFFSGRPLDPMQFCHRPIILFDPETLLEEAIPQFNVIPERDEDDVIDFDVILLWGEHKKVITGADILGRLLRGIVALRRENIIAPVKGN